MNKTILIFVIFLVTASKVSSQVPSYEVYALKYATMAHPTAVSTWATNAPPKDSVNIIFMIWLIKGSNGKNVLVDAGFLSDVNGAKDF